MTREAVRVHKAILAAQQEDTASNVQKAVDAGTVTLTLISQPNPIQTLVLTVTLIQNMIYAHHD